ncbi:hypothetical protein D5018_21410 [Parashewanella curva]|uniref:Uncharacterized protein n=1 Tax=Parashewanella curva TaxID=2338552 RepID=A0A3L8PTD6_9GAMM|nr:hypothetical protein [Parashewanella curva]RLV57658.1 hypothetical protein D5018_21410 [Parashewanella curva]
MDKALDFGYKKLSVLFSIVALLFIFIPPLTKLASDSLFQTENKNKSEIEMLKSEIKELRSSLHSYKKSEIDSLNEKNKTIKSEILELKKLSHAPSKSR